MKRVELGQGVRGLLPEGRLTFGQAGDRDDGGGQASCNDGIKKKKKLQCIPLRVSKTATPHSLNARGVGPRKWFCG